MNDRLARLIAVQRVMLLVSQNAMGATDILMGQAELAHWKPAHLSFRDLSRNNNNSARILTLFCSKRKRVLTLVVFSPFLFTLYIRFD